MRVGVAQIHTVPGAFDQTVERMVTQSQRAAERGVELLAFSLAALVGIDGLPVADRTSFARDIRRTLHELCDRLACPAIVAAPIGLGEQGEHFEALLIEGGSMRTLRSIGLRDPGGTGEHELPTFSYGGLRWAVAFTYADLDDLDDYDYAVDAVLFMSPYPFALDDPSTTMGADPANNRFEPDAQTMDAWLVGAASVGGYGDQVFTGASFVLSPQGRPVAVAPSFEEALLVADIAAEIPDDLPDPMASETFDLPFHLWEAVSLGIRDYVSGAGCTDVALCLDGSLASQVLAALASDALGPLHVHVLVGASAGAAAPTCRQLARRLRVDQVDAVGQIGGFSLHDLDELQLAQLALEHDALVLSSADKTALALGMVPRLSSAGLCPLGDVYHTDILDMAHLRNTISPLFRRVTLTEADALLLPMPDGQMRTLVDEQDVAVIDELLLAYVEYEGPLADIVASGLADLDIVRAVLHTLHVTEHLRRTMPPVLIMSTHTLEDVEIPLALHWDDSLLVPPGPEDDAEPLELLRDARDAEAAFATDSARRESQEPPDLEGTISMLRDLAEQSGFDLSALQSMGQPFGDGGDAAELRQFDPSKMPWMNPFSEN